MSWEECRDAARMYKDGIKTDQVWMELSLERDVRNKKGFFKYTGHKRQAKESIPLLINEKGLLRCREG